MGIPYGGVHCRERFGISSVVYLPTLCTLLYVCSWEDGDGGRTLGVGKRYRY